MYHVTTLDKAVMFFLLWQKIPYNLVSSCYFVAEIMLSSMLMFDKNFWLVIKAYGIFECMI